MTVTRSDENTQGNLERLVLASFASRLFAKDSRLWGEAASAEASIRMNWIDAPFSATGVIERAGVLRAQLLTKGVTRFLLCGMGGSSLGSDVLARSSGVTLDVLDSTHPDAVSAALRNLEDLAVIISSKSGTTVETRSHLAACESAFRAEGIDPAERIVCITDPGTDLEHYGRDSGYAVILADPLVGGRFSVFTAFGIVPPVLAGGDLSSVVSSAQRATHELRQDVPTNPALLIASQAVQEPRILRLVRDVPFPGFPDWLEQLVAESTGKDGTGILPVVTATDHVEVQAERDVSLGSLLMTWQVATAAMCFLLGVNPFDQPDVELAKQVARDLLAGGVPSADKTDVAIIDIRDCSREVLRDLLLNECAPSGFVALLLYAPNRRNGVLEELQDELQSLVAVPVTVGWGPRFLHSTGQFHKGGPRTGVYVQLLSPYAADQEIPGQRYTFGELIRAQADGDARVLSASGQSVFRCDATPEALLSALKGNQPSVHSV